MKNGYLDEGRGGTGQQPRVVVTGAAGFIGSHLADRLLADGCSVLGVDNFDPWYDRTQKYTNLASASQHRHFRLLTEDLNHADLAALFHGVDVVFHLAARPGVQDSWGAGFADSCQLNIALTQRVFEGAMAAGVGRVVYASSSSVYGDGASSGSRVVDPISPYGVSKAAGEQLARVYGRRGLDVVSLRYFTVFGPRQRPDMAMHRLMAAVGNPAEPFHRRGSGEQRREFTFVGDVAAAAATIGLSDQPGVSGGTFDVGGGCSASLNEVIDAIAAIAGSAPEILNVASAPGDPLLTTADIKPLHELVGWQPSTSLAAGLRQQWSWHARQQRHLDLGQSVAASAA
jgi:nucleoside-diphosphate-sugar epimerase